jgi:hypothetical protein
MSNVTGTLLATVVLLLASNTAQAQDDLILLDTPAWRIDAGSNSWFIDDNTARGGAVNPATGHVLVVTRTGGINIVVLDAATGDSLSALDVTGVSGGVYPFNELAITADGQIFGANLTLDGNAKIYYWADEAAVPAVAYDGLISANRYGDAVGIAGSGTDVEFFISGSGNPNVAKLLWDGSALTLDNLFDVGVGRARLGIDPVDGTETAWINGVGTDPALISTVDGSIIAELTGFPDATGSGDIAFIKAGVFDVIVTGPNFNGFGEFSMFDVTSPGDYGMPLKTENFDTNPNTNATAFVDFDEANNRLIVMASNNAIVSYPLTIVHPPVVENIAVENWRIDADSNNWFLNDNNTRGGDYNPATDHILVVSRSGGLKIVALDAETGDSLGVGDVTGITGGTFPLSEIAVTEDGQVFGANLTLDATASNAKIYYWADEASAPVVVYDGAISAHRYGDGIGVGGSGNSVQVYLSGSGSPNVAKFDWDGTTLSAPALIPVDPPGRARFGLDPVPGTESLWVNAPNGPTAALINTADGTVLHEIDEAIANGSGDLEYFQAGAARFVATGTNFNGFGEFAVYNVTDLVYPWTDPPGWTLAGQTPGYPNTNLNGSGFVAYDASRHALIVGVTNNAIVSYRLDDVANTPPPAASITSPPDGAAVTVEGDPGTPFVAMWESVVDDDGDTVTYTWQLAAVPDFASPLVDQDMGSETQFATDFGTVAAILQGAGVSVGGSVTVYHRVITSDGQEQTQGPPASVDLTLGVVARPIVANINVENWRVDAGSTAWFVEDNNIRGGDYNPATDNVLVVSRTGGLSIPVLSAADGSELGLGLTDGIEGGTFPLSEIAITPDGQVFGANLQVAQSAAAPVRIYRWATQGDVPVRVFDGEIPGAGETRFGDGVGVVMEGPNVAFYISGTGNPNIARFVWDGATLAFDTLIPVNPAGRARYGIVGAADPGSLWINSPLNDAAALIATADGSIAAEIMDEVAVGSGDLEFFQDGTGAFLATGTNFNGFGEFAVYDVTDPANAALVGTTGQFPNTNLNGSAFVAYDASRHALIAMATNNAIVSYDLSTSAFTGTPPVINEFVFNHTGSDTNEYMEIVGDPDTDYSAFTLLIVEGDEGNSDGTIDRAYPVGTTDGDGIWWTGFIDGEMENGSQTVLLVEAFSGMVGDDLDADDDGTPEAAPWARIVDDVAISDGDAAPVLYSSVILLPDFDGGVFGAGGASRVPNGTDTDATSDWRRNAFNGQGIPGLSGGTVDVGQVENTPGGINPGGAVATEDTGDLPKEFKLSQNYPNPFNPVTNIQFDMPKTADVKLTVHDVLGRQVAVLVDSQMPAGRHEVLFDARDIASGTYIYRIQAGDYVKAMTLTLVK